MALHSPQATEWLAHMQLINEIETAKRLGCSVRTLQRMRSDGTGPEYCRIGMRRIAYSEEALKAYAASRTHKSRAAELAAS